ncbi:MAG: acetyl-CoA acetyltransferase [Frankiales bacterium]|nr:acetyl-CoA acetyltransferase [Frankiales bacterium]
MLDALARAEHDAGVPGLLAAADAVHAVAVTSWAYDGLAGQVAARVGAAPRTLVDTGMGGHHPARLLDEAAARVWAGDSDVALVVGGEAQASASVFRNAGTDPREAGWSATPGGPPSFDLADLGSPELLEAGLFLPVRVYPLYENRLQADLGQTPRQAAEHSARIYADYSRVAAQHPVAWDPEVRTPEHVLTGTRTVCEPYRLAVNAHPHVDQAAAVVVTSLERALALGVPERQLVHVWGGAGADDDPDVLQRPGFGGSVALGRALDACLTQAGTAVADVDLVDVYSCFPVVPKLVARHLGLDSDAVLTVTGGHSSFGGPFNSYSLHAVATMVERLRAGARTALVHANGGFLTKQHAVLLGAEAHPGGYVGRPEPEQVVSPPVPRRAVHDGLEVVVETATVEHGRDGSLQQAFLVGLTDAGERVVAATRAGDAAEAGVLSLDRLPPGATTHVGRRVRLSVHDGAVAVRPLDLSGAP